MPKRKKRTAPRRKKDEKEESLDDVSESDSLDRPPSAKKVAPASSTCQLEDDVDQISSFTSVSLLNSNTVKPERGENIGLSSHFWCNYCEFSADTKKELVTHMRQHMIKCSYCPFSSLSRSEVVRHCKYEHDKDLEVASSTVSQEVDSSSTDCDMDKDPCSACVFCDFMTYSTEHLEKHTASKHPGMIPKSVAKMITKQVSAQVRRDDALFYLTISNDNITNSNQAQGSSLKSSSGSTKVESSDFIDLQTNQEETNDDVKPKIEPSKTVLESVKTESLPPPNPIKEQLTKDIISDILSQPREKHVGEESLEKKASSTTSKVDRKVKVETMYCLTCPYSNVYVEKIKCHTLVQHPLSAAAATYSNMKEDSSPQDLTFFCVREDCSHSGAERLAYQKHLMDCCGHTETMKVLEKERLKSTLTCILDHQKKHNLEAEEGFLGFVSSYLGLPSSESKQNFFQQGEPGSHSSQIPETIPAKTNTSQQNPDFSTNHWDSGHSSQNQNHTDTHIGHTSTENLHNQGPTMDKTWNNQFQADSDKLWSQPNNQTSQSVVSGHMKNVPNSGENGSSMNTLPLQSPLQLHENQQSAFDVHMSQGSSNSVGPVGNPINYEANSHPILQNSQDQPLMMPSISSNSYAPSPVNQSLNSFHNSETSVCTMGTSSYQNRFDTTFSMAHGNSFGEQLTTADTMNTTGTHVPGSDKDSQPSELNLISDSYSVLLSDGVESGLQVSSAHSESAQQQTFTPLISNQQQFAEPQQPLMENLNNTQAHLTMQNQSLYSSNSMSQSILGNNVNQHPAQTTELLHNNNVNVQSGECYSSQSSSQQTAISNFGNSNPNFQNSQTSSSFGALRNALGRGHGAQTLQASSVPNFLVTSSQHTPDPFPVQQTSVTAQSFLNPGTNPIQAMHTMASVPTTPPQNSNPGNPGGGASPLSPSIYLSGKAPRHRRTNWTEADMRPRGVPLPAIGQRGGLMRMQSPQQSPQAQTPQIPQGHNVRQRLFAPVSTRGRGRGFPRPMRMSAGRVRMPQARMPANNNDDDDVIVTAVVRGPSQQQMQPRQPLPARYPGRGGAGPVARGQRQAPRFQNRAPGHIPGSRNPPPMHPPFTPPKQFDISKHFEDLACVVNSNEEGGVDGMGMDNDEIQIVSVTPGKDKERNQPKAVDASMFSFCCVHCGKDQGSKKVMKQHMKARHNDSLLGAFTNRETGQLLFFCPNLTCEFMTYDERRHSEHLHKCFDLDKSKPFDFGTAIKNLKSMKIRQLDVRTMGRSHNDPIDLDGHGMKDSFSSSLNAAFDEIVENTSGRQIVRPTSSPQVQSQVLPATPSQSFQPLRGAIRGPIRHQYQGSPGFRQRSPGFQDQTLRAGGPHRQSMGFHHQRLHNSSVRGNLRPASGAPRHPRMEMRNVRGMYPRMPAYSAGSGPAQPQFRAQPRLPAGDQQEPIVIDLDADSPEGPEERRQASVVTSQPQVFSNAPAEAFYGRQLASGMNLPHNVNTGLPGQNLDVDQSVSPDDSTSIPSTTAFDSSSSQHLSNTPFYGESSSNSDTPMTHTSTVSSEYLGGRGNPDSQPQQTQSKMLETNLSSQSSIYSNSGQPAETEGSSIHQITSEYANQPVPVTQSQEIISTDNAVADEEANSCPSVSEFPKNTSQVITENSSTTLPQAAVENTEKISSDAETVNSSAIAATPVAITPSTSAPTATTLSSAPDHFDEEEKINAIVLEKVFNKVPNMPKNLSRRLVSKFKQYANYRGVKITPDSKVIDEFVSKISYKGSNSDKDAAAKAAQNQQSVSSATSEPKSMAASLGPGRTNSQAVSDTPAVEEKAEEATPAQTEAPPEKPDDDTKEADGTSKIVTGAESSPEIITTQVILAQRHLQFSGAFASIAVNASTAVTEPGENNSNNSCHNSQPGSQQAFDSPIGHNLLKSDSVLTDTTMVASQRELLDRTARSTSLDIRDESHGADKMRRSSSFPSAISHTIRRTATSPSAERFSSGGDSFISTLHSQSTSVSPVLQLPSSIDNNCGPPFPSFSEGSGGTEVFIPSIENILQHRSPLLGKDVFIQDELQVPFPAASEPEAHPKKDAVVSPSPPSKSETESLLDTDKDSLTSEQLVLSSVVSKSVQSDQHITGDVIKKEDEFKNLKDNSKLVTLTPSVPEYENHLSAEEGNSGQVKTEASILPASEFNSDLKTVKDAVDTEDENDETPELPATQPEKESLMIKSDVELTLPCPKQEPITIHSSVEHIVTGHEGLEVDIAGTPVESLLPAKHEAVEEEDMKPAEEEDMKPVEEEDMKPAEEEDMKPAEEEDMKPAEEEDVKPVGEVNMKITGEVDMTTKEKEDIKTKKEAEPLPDVSCREEESSVQEEEKKPKKSVKQNLELVDPTSGKLIFKVKKRRLIKKQSSKEEEEDWDELKDEEEKEVAPEGSKEDEDEELFVRRSERKRKPVHTEYKSLESNEIDELMSDDDDEYNIDKDEDDYDTDSETEKRDEFGLPLKKKARRVKPPPDPTAFDLSTKGRYKCWLCKKIFSKCTFAKAHIIKKHTQGLCAIDVGQSEETDSVHLLVFCPRECRYATVSLDGLEKHSESCEKPLLKENGEEYLVINKDFLANKYSQLLETPVKTLLEPPKSTPASEKSGKPKKPKAPKNGKSGAIKSSEMASVLISHSEALDPDCVVVSDSPVQGEKSTEITPYIEESSSIQAGSKDSVPVSNADTMTFATVRPEAQQESSNLVSGNVHPSFNVSSSSFPQQPHPTLQQRQTVPQPHHQPQSHHQPQPQHQVVSSRKRQMSQERQAPQSQQQHQILQQEQQPQQTFHQHQNLSHQQQQTYSQHQPQMKAQQRTLSQHPFESTPIQAQQRPGVAHNVHRPQNFHHAQRQSYPQQQHMTAQKLRANIQPPRANSNFNSVQMQHRRPYMNSSQPRPPLQSSSMPPGHHQYRVSTQNQSSAGNPRQNTNVVRVNNSQISRTYQSRDSLSTNSSVNTTRNQSGQYFVSNQPASQFSNNQPSQNSAQQYGRENLDEDIIMVEEYGTICLD